MMGFFPNKTNEVDQQHWRAITSPSEGNELLINCLYFSVRCVILFSIAENCCFDKKKDG